MPTFAIRPLTKIDQTDETCSLFRLKINNKEQPILSSDKLTDDSINNKVSDFVKVINKAYKIYCK